MTGKKSSGAAVVVAQSKTVSVEAKPAPIAGEVVPNGAKPLICFPTTLAEYKAALDESLANQQECLSYVIPGDDLDIAIRQDQDQWSRGCAVMGLCVWHHDHLWLYRARVAAIEVANAATGLRDVMRSDGTIESEMNRLQCSLDRASRFDFKGRGDNAVALGINKIRELRLLISTQRTDKTAYRRYVDALGKAADELKLLANPVEIPTGPPIPTPDEENRCIWFGPEKIDLTPTENFLVNHCWQGSKTASVLSCEKHGAAEGDKWSAQAISRRFVDINQKLAHTPLQFRTSEPFGRT